MSTAKTLSEFASSTWEAGELSFEASDIYIDSTIRWWVDTFFDGSIRSFEAALEALGLTGDQVRLAIRQRQALDRTLSREPVDADWQSGLDRGANAVSEALDRAAMRGVYFDRGAILEELQREVDRRLDRWIGKAFALEQRIISLTADGQPTVQAMRTDDLFPRYPFLARVAAGLRDLAFEAGVESIDRLSADAGEIEIALGVTIRRQTISVTWGHGDLHRCSRTVAFFITGSGQKIVYKPRPMSPEFSYSRLVSWYGRHDPELAPYAYRVLDRGAYGYCEFIRNEDCRSLDEVALFFERVGVVVMLCWVFGISDIHHENIVAAGANPQPIDIEACLDKPYPTGSRFLDFLRNAHADLLLKTGLLPHGEASGEGVFDISALGFRTPYPVSGEGPGSLPRFAGRTITPEAYTGSISKGFCRASTIVSMHGGELLDDPDFVENVRDVRSRWVARPTSHYEEVLRILAHPALLHDGCDAEIAAAAFLAKKAGNCKHLFKIIRSEIEDLLRGDVPYFSTRAGSRNLYDSRENVFESFFASDGVAQLRCRLRTAAELQSRHVSAIARSLLTLPMAPPRMESAQRRSAAALPRARASGESRGRYVDGAVAIGRYIADNAYREGDLVIWPGCIAIGEKATTYGMPTSTLYEGTAGVGLFLAHLYAQTGLPEFRDLSALVIKTVDAAMDEYDDTSYGLFDGWLGLWLSRSYMCRLIGEPQELPGDAAFSRLRDKIAASKSFDVMSGAAGAIIALSRYFQVTGDSRYRSPMAIAADVLQRQAERDVESAWWTNRLPMREVRSGISHGTAGCGWALSIWARESGDEKAADLAAAAFVHEFVSLNGMTTIVDGSGPPDMTWCHGLPGIAIAASCSENVMDASVAHAIRIATRQAFAREFEYEDDSLCHGSMGAADILVALSSQPAARTIADRVLARLEDTFDFRSGISEHGFSAGLMCGLSGIGMGILRAGVGLRIPGILTLEVPKETR